MPGEAKRPWETIYYMWETMEKTVAISLVLVSLLAGCNQTGNLNEPAPSTVEISLKQGKEALLNGATRAICYSGFREGQHPDRGEGAVNPSYQETLEDLQILSKDLNYHLIRLYDSGENSKMVLKVIDENQIDMKVLLGIWLKAEVSNHEHCEWLVEPIPDDTLQQNKNQNLKEIEKGIELANQYPQIIIALAVGNEALIEWNDHMVEVDSVISYVNAVKKAVQQPVTVADNFKWWALHGSTLAKAVDFISIHTYPLWEGQDIDQALAYSIENIKEVRRSLPEARIVITEAGWATVASEFGDRASEVKQAQYYREMTAWAEENNYTLFFFEAFDEPWKGEPGNAQGAEKHWGIYSVNREPKLLMKQHINDTGK